MTAVQAVPSSVVITGPDKIQYVVPPTLTAMLIVEDSDISTLVTEVAPQAAVTERVDQAVVQIGQMGMRGQKGDQGPPGPASPGVTYPYEQVTPATTWTINHNLGQYPAVTVVDTAGSLIYGAVTYNNANQITLNFAYGQAGTAYLN